MASRGVLCHPQWPGIKGELQSKPLNLFADLAIIKYFVLILDTVVLEIET